MNVFISVGTHAQQFDRLLKQADAIAEKKKFEFFAQTGNSKYIPENFKSKKFLPQQEYEKAISEADVVISHGGAGTIINTMLRGKKLIIVPRMKKFGEHTNDHQLELAEAFGREGKAITVKEIGELESALQKAKSFKMNVKSTKRKLVKELKGFLENIN